MKKISEIIALLVILMTFSACDQIVGDPRQMPDNNIDTAEVVQKFLLEKVTGYMCGNCPAANDIAKQIEEAYQGRVIVVSIHAGSYSEPWSKYPYDFRTEVGNALDQFFRSSRSGLPNGLINRMQINNSYIIRPTAWASVIAERLQEKPTLEIKLAGNINAGEKKINAKVDLRYLKESSQNDFLCVYIIENKIIQYQKDYRRTPQDVLDYEHNYVLRAGITSTWGELVSTDLIKSGDKFTREFSFDIPSNSDWNLDNLEIVAFVYSQDQANRILQVENLELE